MKEALCVFVRVCAVEDRGVGEAGVFFLLLTQDNGTAKDRASEYTLN